MKLAWSTYKVDLDRNTGEIVAHIDLSYLAQGYAYVIRAPKQVAIEYPGGVSHVCYVGRSNRASDRKSRISAHVQGWMLKMLALQPTLDPFRVSLCHGTEDGQPIVDSHVEAVVLGKFQEKFGMKPIFNKRGEAITDGRDVEINARFMRNLCVSPTVKAFNFPSELLEEL